MGIPKDMAASILAVVMNPANQPLINKICDLMTEQNITPKNGEMILMYLAGMSLGARMAPATTDECLAALTIGWSIAVSDTEGEQH